MLIKYINLEQITLTSQVLSKLHTILLFIPTLTPLMFENIRLALSYINPFDVCKQYTNRMLL